MLATLSIFRKSPFELLLILLLTAFIYGTTLSSEFVFWDDHLYLMDNPVYERESPLVSIWFAFETPSYYPITFTSFYIQKKLFGWNASAFHAVSLGLHLLNVILFWLVLKKMACAPSVCRLATALYALHPVQTETVAWVTEQKNLWCAFFYWISFFYFLCFLEQPARKRYYAGSALAFLGALLSKSMAVTLPVSLFWWTFLFHRNQWKRIALYLFPFFFFAFLLSSIALIHEQKLSGKPQEPAQELSLQQTHSFSNKLLYSVQSLWFYPYQLFFPRSLSPVYPQWLISPDSWIFPVLILGILGVAFALGVALKRGEKLLPFTLINYGIVAGPILGIITTTYHNTSIVADRYHYHPSPFLLLGIVLLLDKMLKFFSPRNSLFERCFYFAILLGLSFLTFVQAQIWQNSLALWKHAYRSYPHHLVILNNLGVSYFRAGEWTRAEEIFEQYTALYPKVLQAKKKYGELLILQKKWNLAESVFKDILVQNSSLGFSYYGLGQIYQYRQQWSLARQFYQRALSEKNSDWRAFLPLGFLELEQENLSEARHYFSQALSSKIAPSLVHLGMGLCFWQQPSTAETHFNLAFSTNPEEDFCSSILSLWQWKKQAYAEAIDLLLHGLENHPTAHLLRLQLAYFYLDRTPYQSEAQTRLHFQKVPELWNDPIWLEIKIHLLANQFPEMLSCFRVTKESEDLYALRIVQRNEYRTGIQRELTSGFNYKYWLRAYLIEPFWSELK